MSSVELKDVKRRISSTSQIRKVTSALERVSAARLAHDRNAIKASQRYTDALLGIMQRTVAAIPDLEHPLAITPKSGKRALIVFGSDRGLCGAFNTSLLDLSKQLIEEDRDTPLEIVAIGKIIARRIRRLGLKVETYLKQPPRNHRDATLDHIGRIVTDGFRSGEFVAVTVVYSRFVSTAEHVPVAQDILPVRPIEQTSAEPDLPAFEPDPNIVLSRLVSEWLRQALDNAYLNSMGCENAARQMTMHRACENSGRLLGDLTQRYSRLRQESITTEMIELAAATAGTGD